MSVLFHVSLFPVQTFTRHDFLLILFHTSFGRAHSALHVTTTSAHFNSPVRSVYTVARFTMLVVAFSSLSRIGGEGGHSFPACAFSLKWRSACAHRFHFLGQDQFTVAQRAKTTVTECFPTSCVRAGYHARFPHHALTAQPAHSDFVWSRVYAWFSVTCHLHF